jgi:hypothetical protein
MEDFFKTARRKNIRSGFEAIKEIVMEFKN